MSRTARQLAGDAAEDLVAARLVRDGWTILGRQVRLGRHELDIVAIDPGPPPRLVVVEVRWRARRDYGLPEETFSGRKRAHVASGALALLDAGRLPEGRPLPRFPLRIDLVVVEPGLEPAAAVRVRHHRDALGG